MYIHICTNMYEYDDDDDDDDDDDKDDGDDDDDDDDDEYDLPWAIRSPRVQPERTDR